MTKCAVRIKTSCPTGTFEARSKIRPIQYTILFYISLANVTEAIVLDFCMRSPIQKKKVWFTIKVLSWMNYLINSLTLSHQEIHTSEDLVQLVLLSLSPLHEAFLADCLGLRSHDSRLHHKIWQRTFQLHQACFWEENFKRVTLHLEYSGWRCEWLLMVLRAPDTASRIKNIQSYGRLSMCS